MIEQSRATQRRILAARLPMRMRGLSLTAGEPRVLEGLCTNPPDLPTKWAEQVLSGAVVAAEGQYSTCGKGIWAVGPQAAAYLTALMRDLMVNAPFTGLYVTASEYLDQSRPDGDRARADAASEVDLLVLTNTGQEAMSEWSRPTLSTLILKRFDAGLPTLVAAVCEPTEYLKETLAKEIFARVAIMKGTT